MMWLMELETHLRWICEGKIPVYFKVSIQTLTFKSDIYQISSKNFFFLKKFKTLQIETHNLKTKIERFILTFKTKIHQKLKNLF